MSNPNLSSKLVLIDCYGFFYKAHYAFINGQLKNSKGEPTSVIFSFLNVLVKLLQGDNLDKVICILDSKGPSFRKETYPEYKAHRPPMPDELKIQIAMIKDLLVLLGIPQVSKVSFEADDIIAHYVNEIKVDYPGQIEILSSDKDLYQLIDDKVKILIGDKKGGDFSEVGSKETVSKMGVKPEQVVDYLSLLGDSADNVPGVAGIGKVTAVKLINAYGSLEEIYNDLDKVTLSKVITQGIKKKLAQGKDLAFLSKELITLQTEIPDLPKLAELNFTKVALDELIERLDYLEFKSLKNKFLPYKKLSESKPLTLPQIFSSPAPIKTTEQTFFPEKENEADDQVDENIYESIPNFKREEVKLPELANFIKEIKKLDSFVFDLETTDLDPQTAKIVAVVFSFEKEKNGKDKKLKSYYLRVMLSSNQEEKEGIAEPEVFFLNQFKPIFEDPKIKKIGHNLKFEYTILKAKGITLRGIFYDTMVAEYVLNPDKNQFNLEDMVLNYFGFEKKRYKELIKDKASIFDLSEAELRDYTYQDGEFTLLIQKEQEKKLTTKEVGLLEALEIPFISVLAEMEYTGVVIEESILKKLEKKLTQEVAQERETIYNLAGEEFNINSTKQLQVILFQKLLIKPIKKMKTGFSTDTYVLEKLAKNYAIAEHILNYRKYTKLINTYVTALPKLISPFTKRVHTSYNQTVASTGRLSSSNPNLQNIPVGDIGEENFGIRKAFVAPEGYDLVALDYSQVELRVLAWLSKDPVFLNAYQNNLDIHANTASLLFAKDITEIDAKERNIAKTINFSVIYGISTHALSEDLKVSYGEADNFIKTFFASYPEIKNYQQKIFDFAKKNGYVETYYDRIRYVPNINHSQFFLRARAERIAFNTVIQGTASDIIKKAMLSIHKKIMDKEIEAQMVMQVHDELVFYIPQEKTEMTKEILVKALIDVAPFEKILQVNTTKGKDWAK